MLDFRRNVQKVDCYQYEPNKHETWWKNISGKKTKVYTNMTEQHDPYRYTIHCMHQHEQCQWHIDEWSLQGQGWMWLSLYQRPKTVDIKTNLAWIVNFENQLTGYLAILCIICSFCLAHDVLASYRYTVAFTDCVHFELAAGRTHGPRPGVSHRLRCILIVFSYEKNAYSKMNELLSIFKLTNISRKNGKYCNILQENSESKRNYFFDCG